MKNTWVKPAPNVIFDNRSIGRDFWEWIFNESLFGGWTGVMKYDTNPNIIREIPHDYHPFNDPVKRLLDFFLNACFVGKCYCDSKCVFSSHLFLMLMTLLWIQLFSMKSLCVLWHSDDKMCISQWPSSSIASSIYLPQKEPVSHRPNHQEPRTGWSGGGSSGGGLFSNCWKNGTSWSHEQWKKGPCLFRGFVGDEILPRHIEIIS